MGKLSPVKGIGPEQLNLESLRKRLDKGDVKEVILALSNDLEGEATYHYLNNEIITQNEIKVTRIGFGLPSGGDITYADQQTLSNALQRKKDFGSIKALLFVDYKLTLIHGNHSSVA